MRLGRPIAASLPDAAWISKIPSDWYYAQLRRLLHVQSGDFISADTFVSDGYPVFGGNGFRGYAADWNTEAGTLLIGRYGALCGNVHLVQEKVWATEHAFRVFRRRAFDSRFMYYLLQAVNLNQYSARAAQPGLNSTIVEERCVPVPPSTSQVAIAAYLDRETAKIDTLIAKQTEFLKRVDEHSRALVTEVVSHGLDSGVATKATNIPIFPSIPTHWLMGPLMYLVPPARPINYGVLMPGPRLPDGVPLIEAGDIMGGPINPDQLRRTTPEVELPFARSRLKPGDVVVAIRGSVGAAEVVPENLTNGNITRDAARVSPRPEVDSRFLAYVLGSDALRGYYAYQSLGAAVQGINIADLKRAPVPRPPLAEQKSIAESLDIRLDQLNRTRTLSECMIATLIERRTSLIAAAVTGQISVTQPTLTEAAA